MDKYLQEILREVNMIIIPGLGALSITNKVTGEIMFMPYMKHEDKTLAKYIAEKEGWTENEASNLISKYVREIEAKLNSGDSYDMFKFGTFKKDASGDVIFVQGGESAENAVSDDTIEVKEESPAEDNVAPEVLTEEQSDLIDEEIVNAEYVPEISSEEAVSGEQLIDENVADIPEVVEEELSEEDTGGEKPEEEEEGAAEATTETYSEKQQWEDDLDVPPLNAKVEKPKKPILEKARKDKKKKRPVFYVFLVLFVLIISGGTVVGVFYNQIKSALFEIKGEDEDTTILATEKQFEFTEEEPVKEEKKVKKVKEETKSTLPEKIESSEPEKKKPEQKTKVEKKIATVPAEENSPYHLITGSFQNKEFADKFSAKMQAEGNSSVVIGPYNNFYLISIGSYNSQEEAKDGFKNKRSSYPKAWIFRKP